MGSNPSLLYSIPLYDSTSVHSSHYWWSSWSVCLGANVLTLLWMLLSIFIECMLSLECLWCGETMGHTYVHLVHTAEQVSPTIVQFILTMCFYSHFSPTTNSIYNCRISLSLSLASIIPNDLFARLINLVNSCANSQQAYISLFYLLGSMDRLCGQTAMI